MGTIVVLTGTIESGFSYSHKTYNEKFYKFFVSVKRLSGVSDHIPVIVAEKMIDKNYIGERIKIDGEFRSYNKDKEKIRYVYAKRITISDSLENDSNLIFLDGYMCAPSKNRKTPKGRSITDILLAVNRPYGKSDYIPCICWEKNIELAKTFEVGDHLQITGRIQSRKFIKDDIEKTIYEVSVSEIERVKNEN